MLKIKDNVDLKELEKYGFENREYYYTKEINYEYYMVKIDVEKDRKHIHIIIQNDYYDSDYACYIPDEIFNIIQDGLVEKVED